MKILTAAQIREADAYTIKHEPVASIDLMERAALACFERIVEVYGRSQHFRVVCGPGNNGGDGLAIARMLAMQHHAVTVYVINYSEKRSADFISNYERLKSIRKNVTIEECRTEAEFDKLFSNAKGIVIDALFGTGLNKAAEGFAAGVIRTINNSQAEVIAIDVPSGLYCYTLNAKGDAIVNATCTFTFQFPKFSFMLPENADHVGELEVLDIGLHADYTGNAATIYHYVTNAEAAALLKHRSRAAHKGTFGHSLIIAGSYGKMGAAVMASKACLRSGTGLVTARIPKCGYTIMQTALPEAMASVDEEDDHLTERIKPDNYSAIGVGPGIGTEKQTQNVLKMLIQETPVPLVIDADAINIIGENKTWLAFIPGNSIFTPHPKEFERIAGKASDSVERLQLLREFCIKNKVYVVLKGVHTATGCPDGTIFFNSSGNPGMAKGGSGDVLTGMITALVAQRYTSQQSCILGVYLHGLAGDLAARNTSAESMIASDLIECIGDAFNYLSAGNS